MWSLVNNTPFAAERAWDRDRDGVHEWIVAIKGTFSIRPDGSVAIADKQMEPLLLPEYLAEDGTSSLCYDACGCCRQQTDHRHLDQWHSLRAGRRT